MSRLQHTDARRSLSESVSSSTATPKDIKMGPDEVLINEIEKEYWPVQFSHRLHAEMTAMDRGCQDCHHFQEVGGITACKNCHPPHIADENLEQPGLKGAYHRQCLGCHQDWSHDTQCDICHIKKGQEIVTEPSLPAGPGSRFAGLVQPDKKSGTLRTAAEQLSRSFTRTTRTSTASTVLLVITRKAAVRATLKIKRRQPKFAILRKLCTAFVIPATKR